MFARLWPPPPAEFSWVVMRLAVCAMFPSRIQECSETHNLYLYTPQVFCSKDQGDCVNGDLQRLLAPGTASEAVMPCEELSECVE
jgi:hypothetical protein